MALDPFRERYPREANKSDRRIVDLGTPGSAVDSHPNSRRHLQRQFVVLQCRRKADYALRNKNNRFCERMGRLNLDVRELIQAARRADHRRMLGEGVDSLNPFLGFQAPSYEMWGLTYDYLTGYTMKDMSPAPGLATKWTTSSDGKTWTFTVRSGVKWSDGEPFPSEDFRFWWEEVANNKDLAPYVVVARRVGCPDDR